MGPREVKRWFDIALGILVGVFLAGAAIGVALPPRGNPINLQAPPPTNTPPPLIVDVEGAVMRPGTYALPHGSRVDDAIAAAGGFARHALTEAVNRAARVQDGMWIYVPFAGTPTPQFVTPTTVPLDKAVSPSARVNINTATAEELEALPRIGPTLAQRIVDYRTEHGPFQRVDDLIQVKGIGTALLEILRPYVTVGEDEAASP